MDKHEVPCRSQALRCRLNVHLVCNLPQIWTYMGFVYNLVLFSTVKEFWKSIRFWQSYHHHSDGLLFWTQCRWNSTGCRRRLCLRLLWPLTFWRNQYVSCAGTYTTQFRWKYSRRYGIHPFRRAITCSDLDVLTFDPKSWSAYRRTQIHLWPKWRDIPFIGFWALRYGIHKVFWSLPAVILTFNLLT